MTRKALKHRSLVPDATHTTPGMQGGASFFLKFGQCFGLFLFGTFKFFYFIILHTEKEIYTTVFFVCLRNKTTTALIL